MNSVTRTIAAIKDSNESNSEKISMLYAEQQKHASTYHISDAAWFAYLRAIKSLNN